MFCSGIDGRYIQCARLVYGFQLPQGHVHVNIRSQQPIIVLQFLVQKLECFVLNKSPSIPSQDRLDSGETLRATSIQSVCLSHRLIWRQQHGWNWWKSPTRARILSPIDASAERELSTNYCPDLLEGSFRHFRYLLLSSSKPKPSAAVAFQRNKKAP